MSGLRASIDGRRWARLALAGLLCQLVCGFVFGGVAAGLAYLVLDLFPAVPEEIRILATAWAGASTAFTASGIWMAFTAPVETRIRSRTVVVLGGFAGAAVALPGFYVLYVAAAWLAALSYDALRRERDFTHNLRGEVDARSLESVWDALGAEDGPEAYAATGILAARRGSAVAFLSSRLFPCSSDPEWIGRLLADLDHLNPAVREGVSADLEGLGKAAEPHLRRALSGSPTSEARLRLERLLAALEDPQSGFPEARRRRRALRVLSRTRLPEARRVLEALAAGAPEAPFTQEARTALRPDALAR